MIYGSIPLNSNHIDISQTKRGRNPNIGFLSLFSVVVSVTIDDGSFKGIWTSSTPSVATVNDAQVAAVAPGKTTITCTTHNGGYSATCTVVVYGEKKFVLPADLKMIESEAFRQLAMDTVILSSNTESIGSKAFADCDDLRIIYMPDSVVQIAEDAFGVSKNVCFVCESENTAADYAQKHSILYVIE